MNKDYKLLLNALGFNLKDGVVDIYQKEYKQHNYFIEIDFSQEKICYGDLINADNKTTQNFSQKENWVVLECVNRLLEKGYKPQNIILEKTWAAGHGTSGRLDICVNRDDGSEYLLIECKTYGKEFDKAVTKLKKDGGQLFTYFKFSNKADVIMLYASEFQGKKFEYKNEIVKIEEAYRSGDVKDFYDKWNKLTKDNGIFETWVKPYSFESKALVRSQLKPINQEDSSFIFNRFLEILRHNVVSDKGNAFNKIFTLFLCKVYDETSKQDDEELDFQWKEGIDDHVKFQLRLTDLYKKGMDVFLSRTVSDFNEEDFKTRCSDLNEETKKYFLEEVNKLRLEKNNEFAIKEVYDHDSFIENAKIVKEVVELLQGYRIRYNKRQQYLSDFFELLLTTGLKQEAGQFFTPVPIAQFIIKSLPLEKIVDEKLNSRNGELLPYMIDYAAGSGHFITEYMHEIQNMIVKKIPNEYIEKTSRKIKNWQLDPYDWANEYVYGVEKDYRLVKVGKVGCYLHGDGLAKVILSDGLGNFVKTKDYKGKLHKQNDDNSKDNQQFDILLSNPPYSVSAFRQTTRDYYTEKDFDLYDKLTDNSSEIECLFVERAKQLLKDGGIAGVILPNSILTNAGIYTKTRELLLKYFEFVAITELGSNTFMATGTNTVILFLRRRNNFECINYEKLVDKFFSNHIDVTINSIETPVAKYVNYVWEGLSFDDYLTLLVQKPNDNVKKHVLFKEYSNKIKTDKEFWNKIIDLEKEKIYYFILAYPQKLVIVKTGEKDAEKQFLGYEFSNRRGSEGIHPIQKNKTIDECTKLFDINSIDNPQKASTYIYKAFENNFDFAIDETLKDNITKVSLLDMMTFDRVDFEKHININSKKKVKIESKWQLITIENIVDLIESGSRPVGGVKSNKTGVLSLGGEHIHNTSGFLNLEQSKYVTEDFYNKATLGKIKSNDILLCKDGALTGKIAIVRNELDNKEAMVNEHVFILRCSNIYTQKYVFYFLHSDIGQNILKSKITGAAQGGLNSTNLKNIQIPHPPLDIQQKIVDEIEKIENINIFNRKTINELKFNINQLINNCFDKYQKLLISDISTSVEYGTSSKSLKKGSVPVIRMGNIQDGKIVLNDLVYTNDENEIKKYILKYNDVLFNRTNSPELVGKVGIYQHNLPAIFAGYLIRINYIKDRILPLYLAHILNSDKIRNYGFSVMTKSVHQANINGTLLKNYEIPVPPIKDQQKIVSQIEELEKQIAKARSIIDNSKQQKQEILDKYLK